MFGHTYSAIRLAVPLRWHTRLISNLGQHAALEVPITFASLLALPIVLSIRRYRSLFPRQATWASSYHLVSGNDRNSLISASKQGTLILLISGFVSLLIQFPINLLKGEVVSSPFEQRIQPSKCTVRSCFYTGYRMPWFEEMRTLPTISVLRLRNFRGPQAAVIESNMEEACLNTSVSTISMHNETKLALLLQYITICNDPELMHLEAIRLRKHLLLENIAGSQATQPFCSVAESNGGQVLREKHSKVACQILEHDLLKHIHLQSSLYPLDRNEKEFWLTKPMRKKAIELSNTINKTVGNLRDEYKRLNMFGDKTDSSALGLRETREIFVAFIGASLIIGTAFAVKLLSSYVFVNLENIAMRLEVFLDNLLLVT